MKLLTHVCCAPCYIAPFKHMQSQNIEQVAFWFNPNIHPVTEFYKRMNELQKMQNKYSLKVIYDKTYSPEEFLQNCAYRESSRCAYCYYLRLDKTAQIAKRGKFDYFTTTLLYSKFQKHDLIIEVAESVAKKRGVKFYYKDFREYWKEGIELSKAEEMYRQQYCGCIFSERDRYEQQLSRLSGV